MPELRQVHSLKEALGKAVRFLEEKQQPDGSWTDYQLITGESTSWVTAYTGLSLLHVLQSLPLEKASDGLSCRIRSLMKQARHFLLGEQGAVFRGWGYNGGLRPDCDSTALALQFLLGAGTGREHPYVQQGLDFLQAARREDGGCSTYLPTHFPGENYAGWTGSHLSVTAAAAGVWALFEDDTEMKSALTAAQAYCITEPGVEELWLDYWWVGPYYPTGMIAGSSSLSSLFDEARWSTVSRVLMQQRHAGGGYGSVQGAPDCFATAWTMLILSSLLKNGKVMQEETLLNGLREHIYDGILWLLGRQQGAGGFPSGAYMRIPNPSLPGGVQREADLAGRITLDINGVFTSATVLRSLAAAIQLTEMGKWTWEF